MEVYFKETSKLLCAYANKPVIEYPILRERVIEYPILCEHEEERHYKFSVYVGYFYKKYHIYFNTHLCELRKSIIP